VRSWKYPAVPHQDDAGPLVRLWDTTLSTLVRTAPAEFASLYVCGITPYDATHIGHAATFIAYDILIRSWLDAGYDVAYVQNVTDVDDPLLERATATGVNWRDLAAEQIQLFRDDMEQLSVIPPNYFIGVTESIPAIAAGVHRLLESGIAYRVDGDIYFDSAAAAATSDWYLGAESGLGRDEMLSLSSERGGDPHRPGKHDPLDPLLWRGAREGEPHWHSSAGDGRPGWHIECSVLAAEYLELPMTVSGGASDLIFPHHEFTAGHTGALTGYSHASIRTHAGLVSYRGQKMSKSLGNLVFVSTLISEGVDPRAIRLAILSHHYRSDWEWTDAVLDHARERLTRWTEWAAITGGAGEGNFVNDLRAAIAHDLNAPRALKIVDERITLGAPATEHELAAIHGLLGISLDTPAS
jgi:L-cysteine:1D-myo-inositol 2-amino-2-deoxy-alpha-D-glucopyranoside ligase